MSTSQVAFDPTAPYSPAVPPASAPAPAAFDPTAPYAPAPNTPAPVQTGPTPAQRAYRQATASGPFVPAGAAEKAMGAEIGDNTAQAKAALSDTLSAAGETAAGVTGAQIPGAIAEVLPAVIPSTIEGMKSLTAWAAAHPVHAYVLYNVLKDLVPGAKKAIGLVKGAPSE
ncbi:MAG: hypothetical protein WBW31_09565 [Candidatus Sulfotelmatobacter sp.]